MSQNLHFYKLKILQEDLAAQFKRDEIDKALKALLANRKLDGEDADLRKRIFEEIEVDIEISGYDPKLEKFLSKKELSLSSKSRIFLMTEEIWAAISECIFEECAKKFSTKDSKKKKEEEKSSTEDSNKNPEEKSSAEDSNKKDDFKETFERVKPLLKDYFILDELFKKNLLVVNMF